jgi:IMP dehydrogenase
VADESNHLLGIVTYRDIVFEDGKKKISEVMTPREKLVTAKPGISIEEAKEILKAHKEILKALTIVRYDSLDATLRCATPPTST